MAKKQKFDIDDVDPKYRKCQLPKAGNNIISCLARMSYPHLQKVRPLRKGDATDKKRKFSVELLIPPEFSIKLLKEDVQRAIHDQFGDNPPKRLKSPFLEAGDYDKEGYEAGWTLIRANTDVKPEVIDGLEMVKITDPDDPAIYSGRWCLATLRAYYYEVDGNRGVSLGLGNVRLMHHDEPIGGGRVGAAKEFGDELDDDASEDYEDTRKGKKKLFDEDEEEDERPRRSSSRRVADDEDEDEPRRPAKKPVKRVADDEDEDEPRRPAKKRQRGDEDYD